MEITYLEAIRSALREEMERDEAVFLLGEDIGRLGGAFGVTAGLLDQFGPERVVDTPISESAIIGVAIGAAMVGRRPVAEMQFMDFISCGFDQVVNQAATMSFRCAGQVTLPLVIRGPCGGGVHGGIFHSQMTEAWFFRVPGLKLVAPATPYDAKGLLKAALRDNNPVLYLEHKYLYRRAKGEVPEGDFLVPIGEAEVKRPGTDLTLVTYSATLHQSLAAAEQLESEGLSVEVVDLRSLKPLDMEAVRASFEKTNKALIVHEDRKAGGIGAEIAATLAEECFELLDGPIMRVGAPDTHCAFSPPLEEFYLPNTEKIVEAARRLYEY